MFMKLHKRSVLMSVLAIGVLSGSVIARQEAPKDPEAAKIKNPVPSTPESIAAGKKTYDANCAGCHGNVAQGAEKAGLIISVIEDQGGKQPPDLTDDKSDHGSTDGEIFTVIKKGHSADHDGAVGRPYP